MLNGAEFNAAFMSGKTDADDHRRLCPECGYLWILEEQILMVPLVYVASLVGRVVRLPQVSRDDSVGSFAISCSAVLQYAESRVHKVRNVA